MIYFYVPDDGICDLHPDLYAVDLIDLRAEVDEEFSDIATAAARELPVFRVLSVGTDSNIGKMTTAIQLEMYCRWQAHIRARFVATGQHGILIKGRGTRLDRVLVDFTAGAAEALMRREAVDMDMLLIEGQGSLLQPAFSGVCLGLLHGCCPDAMILCHSVERTHHRHTDVPIPELLEYAHLYEHMLRPLHPHGKVVAISLKTFGMKESAAQALIAQTAEQTGLPTADTVREGNKGCARLNEALLQQAQACGKTITPVPGWYHDRYDDIKPLGARS